MVKLRRKIKLPKCLASSAERGEMAVAVNGGVVTATVKGYPIPGMDQKKKP